MSYKEDAYRESCIILYKAIFQINLILVEVPYLEMLRKGLLGKSYVDLFV